MTPEQINIECALVDGWVFELEAPPEHRHIWHPKVSEHPEDCFPWSDLPNYTTSYDAIIPLIQKQTTLIRGKIYKLIEEETGVGNPFDATPQQLATALIKALGRWKK